MKKPFFYATTVGIALFSVICASPGIASANQTELNNSQIQNIIESYSNDIEQSYIDSQNGITPNTLQEIIAHENGAETIEYTDYGLSLTDVDTKSTTLNTHKLSDEAGYQVSVSITTKLLLKAEGDTTITIAGEQREFLDTEITDIHNITIKPIYGDSIKGYSVVDDEIQPFEDTEYVDEQPINVPLLEPENVINGTRRKRAVPTDPFTNKAGLNYIKAAKYAEEWTKKENENKYNPDFPIYPTNNCTNFVSQAIYAGGLPTTYGNSFDIKNPKVWTWNLKGIAQATRTWTAAHNNYHYMKDYSGAFTVESSPWRVGEGGLIYGDWGNDGTIDHAMIVVGHMGGPNATPIICQKTKNRHNYPFRDSVKNAPKTTKWYALQWKAEW